MIDCYASWRHFADHLSPVWMALPPEVRGQFSAPVEVAGWLERPDAPWPTDVQQGFPDRRSPDPVLVASFADYYAIRPRPAVMVNHGAGQTYLDGRGPECYSGGPGRDRVILDLEPGPLAAAATAHEGRPLVQIGCPKLDPWHSIGGRSTAGPVLGGVGSAHDGVTQNPPTVTFAFHHTPPQACPEQRSAWDHYAARVPEIVADLAAVGIQVLGHGHPRSWGRVEHDWARMGVEPVGDFFQILDRADVLVTDTSSVGIEFASTGRPVIWCSAPWYRRDVEHGGRWWDWTRHALHVQDPDDLADAILEALTDDGTLVAAQWPMVDGCYALRDGTASVAAAAAVTELLSAM